MNQKAESAAAEVDGLDKKVFFYGLLFWVIAQLIRFVALPLISSIIDGVDAAGWMYPAILDIIAASLALPLAFAIWRWRNFTTWSCAAIYLTLSIVDHIGALTNLTIIGEPLAFAEMTNGGNPYVVPTIQTLLDIIFLWLLVRPRYRSLFFEVS